MLARSSEEVPPLTGLDALTATWTRTLTGMKTGPSTTVRTPSRSNQRNGSIRTGTDGVTIKRWELSASTISPSIRPSGETRTETGGATTKPTAPPRSTISRLYPPNTGTRTVTGTVTILPDSRAMFACNPRPRKWTQAGSVATTVWGAGTSTRTGFRTPPTCGRLTRLGSPMPSLTILPSGTTRTTTVTATTSSISTDKRGGPPTVPTAAAPRRANRRSTAGVAPTGTGMVGPTRPPFGWPVRAVRGMHGLRTPPSGTTPTVMAVAIIREGTQPTFALL